MTLTERDMEVITRCLESRMNCLDNVIGALKEACIFSPVLPASERNQYQRAWDDARRKRQSRIMRLRWKKAHANGRNAL